MTEIIPATTEDVGCWIEGHRGWTGPSYLVEIAESRGMPLDDDDRAILAAYNARKDTVTLASGETVDAYDCVLNQGELADKAEEWLNDNAAPDGYRFGWEDGEFFLWPDHNWRPEDYGDPMPCGCVPHKTRTTLWGGFYCDSENQPGYCNFECPHQDD